MPPAPPVSPISLLWPPEAHSCAPDAPRLSPEAAADLDLDSVARALSASPGDQRAVYAALASLCADPNVIAYRQAVLEDLLNAPELLARLEALLPAMRSVERFRYSARPGQTPLHEVVWRVGQLEAYVECVRGLNEAFAGQGAVESSALVRLREQAARAAQDSLFAQLERELPEMVKAVRSVASITIGVNLDDQLRPVGAALIDIHDRPFRADRPSLFAALFGGDQQDGQAILGPLHSIPRERSAQHPSGVDFTNPLLYPLFRDLAQVLKHASRPVARALQRFVNVGVTFFAALHADLAFYVGAVRLIERLRAAGLPVCRPEIAPVDERACQIADAYNLTLALRALAEDSADRIVTNDIRFDDAGRIFILTGPNQGGKTTYAQAIGLAQVLAQAGLYVPGTRARISPVDAIYTHFPAEEAPGTEAGRLGEEATRLNAIFGQATRASLVILNESLSSTSAGESLYLAVDPVRILRLLGARAVFATHLHELANEVGALNAEPGDSPVASLVSLVEEHASESGPRILQTYRIVPGPPRGRSYAREIAARYGISYEQLRDRLRARGLLDGDA